MNNTITILKMSLRKMGTTPDLRTQLLNFSIAVFFAMPSVMGRVKKKKKARVTGIIRKKGLPFI